MTKTFNVVSWLTIAGITDDISPDLDALYPADHGTLVVLRPRASDNFLVASGALFL